MSREALGYGHILEFGGGTGPITRQLSRDHGNASLTVFELDTRMAENLAKRYPLAQVWDGCLHDRADILLSKPPQTVAVSSLPFRSLPKHVLQPTIRVIEAFLTAEPLRKLVQFTYGLRPPFDPVAPGLSWTRHTRVWANLPPASIWTLQSRKPVATQH